MRLAARIMLCTLGLAGCAAPPAPYGNFVQEAPAGYGQTLADDAARQLAAVYPPANTRLELQQAAPDAFGTRLTASLRARGYAIRDAVPVPVASGPSARREDGPATAAAPVLQLRYVLDRAGDLYRVTLHVGDQSLARAYVAQNAALRPAGAWVRKE
jgi:hypothetical protein